MEHVLLITYYWPPAGGAGVHRWLRFSNYFSDNDCHLTVYCPSNANWPIIDEKLNESVPKDITILQNKIFEPQKYLPNNGGFNAGAGLGTSQKLSLTKKLIIWLRGNLFIPDSRKFWIKPSARYLSKYLKNHPEITTVISTGPPHSCHLIAQKLKAKFNLKWIADFRDPWTEIDFYKDLLPGKRADSQHKKLEKSVLTEADRVVTVSDACAEGLAKIGNREVDVITNGYIFPEFDPKSIQLDKRFSIAHFGSMPFSRNPLVVWKSLAELLQSTPELSDHLEIKLIGSVDYKVIESLTQYGLHPYLTQIAQVSHHESVKLQTEAQLLLLVANNTGNVKGILTGKFFEYLGAQRPILAIGEANSDLEKEVITTECGAFIDYEDQQKAMEFIRSSFELYAKSELWSTAINRDKFSSETLTKKYIDIIRSI